MIRHRTSGSVDSYFRGDDAVSGIVAPFGVIERIIQKVSCRRKGFAVSTKDDEPTFLVCQQIAQVNPELRRASVANVEKKVVE